MIDIIKKHQNIFFSITLLVLYVVFVVFSWEKWGHPFYDCFREAVIPEALIDGKVLYRDILNLYPPLAYYVNSSLFGVFGCNLTVLYFCGIFCGVVVLTMLHRLIKNYASDFTAFIITLFVMGIFVFRISINNFSSWFFPYSYSFLYAFTCCFSAICLYARIKKNSVFDDKSYFSKMCIISLLIGFSIAFKWDFILVGIIPFYEACINRSPKLFLIYFGLMIIPSILTFGIWFKMGGTVADFNDWINFLYNFAKAPSVLIFNEKALPQSFSVDVLKDVIVSFKFFCKEFCLFSILGCLYLKFVLRQMNNRFLKFVLLLLLLYFVCIPAFNSLHFEFCNFVGINKGVVFVPYIVWILAFSFIFVWKKKKFTDNHLLFVILTFIGFGMTFRNFAEVTLSLGGNFTIIPYFVAFLFFMIEILPDYLKFFDKNIIKTSVIIGLSLFVGIFCVSYYNAEQKYTDKICSEKGCFYIHKGKSAVIKQTLDFLEKDIPNDSTVLVANEGLLFNWFSGKKSDLKHYALIPHIIEALGEDNLIEDFQKKSPDYFVITDNYYPYSGLFGVDYAKKINDFVLQNYEQIKLISSSSSKIVIYKRK